MTTWTTLRDLTTPQAAEGRTAPLDAVFLGLKDANQFTQDGNRDRVVTPPPGPRRVGRAMRR